MFSRFQSNGSFINSVKLNHITLILEFSERSLCYIYNRNVFILYLHATKTVA